MGNQNGGLSNQSMGFQGNFGNNQPNNSFPANNQAPFGGGNQQFPNNNQGQYPNNQMSNVGTAQVMPPGNNKQYGNQSFPTNQQGFTNNQAGFNQNPEYNTANAMMNHQNPNTYGYSGNMQQQQQPGNFSTNQYQPGNTNNYSNQQGGYNSGSGGYVNR